MEATKPGDLGDSGDPDEPSEAGDPDSEGPDEPAEPEGPDDLVEPEDPELEADGTDGADLAGLTPDLEGEPCPPTISLG